MKEQTLNATLTPRRQLGVDIALDVLERLKAKKLKVSDEDYFVSGLLPRKVSRTAQISKHLSLIEENCTVCAKGALFLGYVALKNDVTFGSCIIRKGDETYDDIKDGYEGHEKSKDFVSFNNGDIKNVLEQAFTNTELALIETAFEGEIHPWNRFVANYEFADQKDRAIAFGKKYKSASARLKAICENIVENNGEFVV